MEERRIKYTIMINQKAVIDNMFDLDVIDMCIFDFICYFSNSISCKRTTIEGREFFWISHKKIISELPIIKITSKPGIIKRIQKLEKAGLLERYSNCREENMTYYRFGKNYELMFVGTSIFSDRPPLSDEIDLPLSKSIDNDTTNTNDTTINDLFGGQKEIFVEVGDIKTEFLKEFNRVKCSLQPTRVMDEKATRQLKILLKAGYTIQDVGKALENAMKTRNHKENKFVYLTPEFITRPDKFNIYHGANFENTSTVRVNGDSDYE